MTDHRPQIEFYMRGLRSRAWAEFIYPRSDILDPTQAFARAVKVYEDELEHERALTAQLSSSYLRVMSQARDVAYEMLDQLVNPCPEREDTLRIIAELDKVLGPDLVREADPTGTVLKPLPHADRKAMLDTLDMVEERKQALGDHVDEGELTMIVIDEDILTADERKRMLETLNGLGHDTRKIGVFVERDRREQQVAHTTFEGVGGAEALLRGPQREEDGPAAAEEGPVRGGR